MKKFLTILALAVLSLCCWAEKESYAIFDEASGTLTFKYGEKPDQSEIYLTDDTGTAPLWSGRYIRKIVFDSSFAEARPRSTASWFSFSESLTEITGLQYLNTSNVTDMSWMFSECEALTSIDLSHFDTSNVTNMRGMFNRCLSLLSLDLSHFDTSNVTDMWQIFYQCYELTSLDISNFDVRNIESLHGFLYDANNLIDLKMDHFRTSEKLKDLSYMFYQCTNLKRVDLSGFNTSNVEDMSGMFSGCQAITSLDLSHFDTKKVTDMSRMFCVCENLVSLDISSFDTGNVENMDGMFDGCRSLTKLDITNFNTSKVKSMERMFMGCYEMPTLDLTSFDTRSLEKSNSLFNSCRKLNKIYVSDHWDFSNVIPHEISPYASGGEFSNCLNLIGGKGTNYESYKNTDIMRNDYCRIDGGPSAPGLLTAAHQEEGVTYTIEGSSASIINGSGQNEDVEIPSDMCIGGQTVAVTTISEDAFKDSYKLKIVSIPESIEEIGNSAFAGCSDLKAIYCSADEPVALGSGKATVLTRAVGDEVGASSVFDKVDKENCMLYVPASSIDRYKNAPGWKEFKHIEKTPSNLRGDANNDWMVDQQDAKTVADFIMTYEQLEGFVWRNADANGDVEINVADIVTIMNTK